MCEEWWEITHENNLNYLDRLFKDETVRRSVRQALILQILAITICYVLSSERSTNFSRANLLSEALVAIMKNLLFYTH